MSENSENPTVTDKPRKRPILGRKQEIAKKLRLKSHETGKNCNCKLHKCFEKTSFDERSAIVAHFNSLPSKDEQDSFLASRIQIVNVKRRRSRKGNKVDAQYHDYTPRYFVYIERDGTTQTVYVCAKAFVAFFGVTKARVERIRVALAHTGKTWQLIFQNINKIIHVSEK